MDQAVASTVNPAPAEQVYRLTPGARRTVLTLLLGVLAIAVYAVWTLVALVAAGLSGADWVTAVLMLLIAALSPAVAWSLWVEWSATVTTGSAGLSFHAAGVQLRYDWPAVGTCTPLATRPWRLPFGDKARSAGRTAEPESGLPGPPVDSLAQGVTAATEAQEASGPAPPDGDADEILVLAVDPPAPAQIGNPLVRLLYRQAYGDGIPLYAGLANRPALLGAIATQRSGPRRP